MRPERAKATAFTMTVQAADPYREHFAPGDSWRREHPEFEPKLCFYAFKAAVEHVQVSINYALAITGIETSSTEQNRKKTHEEKKTEKRNACEGRETYSGLKQLSSVADDSL